MVSNDLEWPVSTSNLLYQMEYTHASDHQEALLQSHREHASYDDGPSLSYLRRLQVHGLQGSENSAYGIRRTLQNQSRLFVGLRLDGDGAEFIVSSCDPAIGWYDSTLTDVTIGDDMLPVFEKVHMLPFERAVHDARARVFREHVVPYFQRRQRGTITKGFEFTFDGVRCRVVAVSPDAMRGVVGRTTELYFNGQAIAA